MLSPLVYVLTKRVSACGRPKTQSVDVELAVAPGYPGVPQYPHGEAPLVAPRDAASCESYMLETVALFLLGARLPASPQPGIVELQ